MTRPKNIAAFVRRRLFELSRERQEVFDFVLTRYALERFLYRLSVSEYRARFLLKGAMLFTLWTDIPHRPTRDIDLLGFGSADIAGLESLFKEICALEADDDGVVFLPETVQGRDIRAEKAYTGVRITLQARIEQARCPIQVDIGFGDAVTPEAEEADYPAMLGFPAPRLKVYPIYTVIAEKLEAMVSLDFANSRMKDFYDVWMLLQHAEFDKEILHRAILATFTRRGTPLPTGDIPALSTSFANEKAPQWAAFLRKNRFQHIEFFEVINALSIFFAPVLENIAHSSGEGEV
jgi:predicted nucleotidyltransferase component of viral defense system